MIKLRRAATSVTSNIAEGFGRHSYKEKANFYRLAEGSLTELENQLLISKDIGYLSGNDFNELQQQLDLTHRLLCGLISKTKSFISNFSSPKSILYSLFSILCFSILFSISPVSASTVSKSANSLTNGLVGYWTMNARTRNGPALTPARLRTNPATTIPARFSIWAPRLQP